MIEKGIESFQQVFRYFSNALEFQRKDDKASTKHSNDSLIRVGVRVNRKEGGASTHHSPHLPIRIVSKNDRRRWQKRK